MEHPEKVLGEALITHDDPPNILQPGKESFDLPSPSVAPQRATVLCPLCLGPPVRRNQFDAMACLFGIQSVRLVSVVADETRWELAEKSLRECPKDPENAIEHRAVLLPADAQRMRTWSYGHVKMHISNDNPFEAEELGILRTERTRTEHVLGDMPLIVLSRGLPEDSNPAGQAVEQEHNSDQTALVSLSRMGKRVVAKRSGHHIPLDEPDLVVAAISDVVAAARR